MESEALQRIEARLERVEASLERLTQVLDQVQPNVAMADSYTMALTLPAVVVGVVFLLVLLFRVASAQISVSGPDHAGRSRHGVAAVATADSVIWARRGMVAN